jgi:hypothetical protein
LLRDQLERQQAKRNRPEEQLEHWLYPKAGGPSSRSGDLHQGVYTTADSLEQVVTWYEKKLGRRFAVDTPGHGIESGPEATMAFIADSFQPRKAGGGEQLLRAIKIAVASRTSDASVLTVVVNRLAGEDATHIILSFAQK